MRLTSDTSSTRSLRNTNILHGEKPVSEDNDGTIRRRQSAVKKSLRHEPSTSYLSHSLRHFIAEDAIRFSQTSPVSYCELVERNREDFGQYAKRHITSRIRTLPNLRDSKTAVSTSSKHSRSLISLEDYSREPRVRSGRSNWDELSLPPGGGIENMKKMLPINSADNIIDSYQHLAVTIVGCFLNVQHYVELQRLAMIWGGFVVLIPYTILLISVTIPIMTLELAMGNICRAGFGKTLRRNFGRLNFTRVISFTCLLINLVSNTLSQARHCFILKDLVAPNPHWLPSESQRQDCEQTQPKFTPCNRKEGCIYSDYVCTTDPLYWAAQNYMNTHLRWCEVLITIVTLLIVAGLSQRFSFQPLAGFAATTILCGLLVLAYLCFQDVMQTHNKLGLNMAAGDGLKWEKLLHSGMWLAMGSHSLSAYGIGTGMNYTLGSMTRTGTNMVKVVGIVFVVDLLFGASFIAVGRILLVNLAQKTEQTYQELRSSVPHLLGVMLTATVGNVGHKKFIGSLIVATHLITQMGKILLSGYCLLQMIRESDILPSKFQQDSKTGRALNVGLLVVSTAIVMAALALLKPIDSHGYYSADGGFIHLAFFEVVAFGWLKYMETQIRTIGAPSTISFVLFFPLFAPFLIVVATSLLHCFYDADLGASVPRWLYTTLPVTIFEGLGLLLSLIVIAIIIYLAYAHTNSIGGRTSSVDIQRSMTNQDQIMEAINSSNPAGNSTVEPLTERRSWSSFYNKSGCLERSRFCWMFTKTHFNSLWWILIGNVELLRFDLNTLLTGASLLRFEFFWSICIKYISVLMIPLLAFNVVSFAGADNESKYFMEHPSAATVLKESKLLVFLNDNISLDQAIFMPPVMTVGCIIITTAGSMIISRYYSAWSVTVQPLRILPRKSIPDRLAKSWNSLKAFFFEEYLTVSHTSHTTGNSNYYGEVQNSRSTVTSTEWRSFKIPCRQQSTVMDHASILVEDRFIDKLYQKIGTAVFERIIDRRMTDIEKYADSIINSQAASRHSIID